MARYIKANPKVAEYLRLEKDRNKVKDGNYLLWQADILPFGRLTELPQILEQIGGIALQAHEARQEQDGTVCRELPTATDSRFVVEKPANTEKSAEVPETPAESAEKTEATDETTTEGEEVPVEETPAESITTENTETV
jgi:hypothetical protein